MTTSPPESLSRHLLPTSSAGQHSGRLPFYPRFCRNASPPSSPDKTACRDAAKNSMLKAPRFACLTYPDPLPLFPPFTVTRPPMEPNPEVSLFRLPVLLCEKSLRVYRLRPLQCPPHPLPSLLTHYACSPLYGRTCRSGSLSHSRFPLCLRQTGGGSASSTTGWWGKGQA